MLCPSTPAAPLFRATLHHAASRVAGRMTLSTRLNHLPPLTPLTSADTMRSVQIDASTHHQRGSRLSVPCLAFSGTAETSSCVMPDFTPPTSYPPSLGMVLLPIPPAATRDLGTMRALPPAELPRARQVSPLTPRAVPTFHPHPRRLSDGRFISRLSAIGCSRLRHACASSPQRYAESGLFSYRLPVHLRLLSTPPRGDAVTFDYGASDRPRRGLPPR